MQEIVEWKYEEIAEWEEDFPVTAVVKPAWEGPTEPPFSEAPTAAQADGASPPPAPARSKLVPNITVRKIVPKITRRFPPCERLPSPTTTATVFAARAGAGSGAKLPPARAAEPNTAVAQPGSQKAVETSPSQGTGMLHGAAKAGSPQGGEVEGGFFREGVVGDRRGWRNADFFPRRSGSAALSAARSFAAWGSADRARRSAATAPASKAEGARRPRRIRLFRASSQAHLGSTTALLEGARSVPDFHVANLSSGNVPLLTEREAAAWAGLSAATLQNWRVKGYGPPWLKLSARAICYRTSDVEAWLASRVRRSTSDTGNNNA